MFKPLALYIGLRYTRAKRRNHFISFISCVSTIGIALGIAVLITVLSVMNGFDAQIKKHVFSMTPEMTVSPYGLEFTQWKKIANKLSMYPEVLGVAPFIEREVLLTHDNNVAPVLLSGISPTKENNVSEISDKMQQGSLADLDKASFGIILGQRLATTLGAFIGTKITVMTPDGSVSLVGYIPRVKRFTVVGIFHAGDGFGFDSNFAFVNLHDAQTLFRMNDSVTGVRLKVDDVFQVNQLTEKISADLNGQYAVSNWTYRLGAFFKAIALEKNMMFIILLMIIAVAAFNLVSSLVMIVNEKSSDIAILRTLGATPCNIMNIFIVQGAVVGIFALLLGLLGGILLTYNVNAIASFIQHTFHVQLISSSVYFIDYLPYEFQLWDILRVCFIALVMSLVATLYPAWRAARTQPAEALRYE